MRRQGKLLELKESFKKRRGIKKLRRKNKNMNRGKEKKGPQTRYFLNGDIQI